MSTEALESELASQINVLDFPGEEETKTTSKLGVDPHHELSFDPRMGRGWVPNGDLYWDTSHYVVKKRDAFFEDMNPYLPHIVKKR